MESVPTGRPKRILVGTTEICGMIPVFADAFRALGNSVTTVVRERNPFLSDQTYDVEIGQRRVADTCTTLKLIASHDVFVYIWGGSSLMQGKNEPFGNREFRILKFLGKKLVCAFSGTDIRYAPAYAEQFPLPPGSPESYETIFKGKDQQSLEACLWNLRSAERYADVLLSVRSQESLAVRPYHHFFPPVDCSRFRCVLPNRDRPVVVHAPSHRNIKGTSLILAALERLKRAGIAFELRLLENLPQSRIACELTDADVVVDELYLPMPGMLSLESMASGCAVARYDDPIAEPLPADRPVCRIGATNLDAPLQRLLTDKAYRIDLAKRGRPFVERYHDHVKVASRILEQLRYPTPPDHSPTFFTEHFFPSTKKTVPKYLEKMTEKIRRDARRSEE